tara:strand:- start:292 stop:456 length:165 start_codon:yes stop_codon:yes gene_type:complete
MADKLVQLILYNPHITDFIYQREDGTYYSDRRNHGQTFLEVTKVDGKWVLPPPT